MVFDLGPAIVSGMVPIYDARCNSETLGSGDQVFDDLALVDDFDRTGAGGPAILCLS